MEKADTYPPGCFVSPETGAHLRQQGTLLVSSDGREQFPIENHTIMLLGRGPASAENQHATDVFNALAIQDLPYFRSELYTSVLEQAFSRLPAAVLRKNHPFRFAELGGGEGFCARYVKALLGHADVFVCDISRAPLARSPQDLIRVCADITRPIFAPELLQASAFWVSLHHLPEQRRGQAFAEAYCALAEGGVLVVFEPNDGFILRRLLYSSPFRRDVYFDEQENAIDVAATVAMAQNAGFTELETVYLNPPYNYEFVRKLKRWYLYYPAVQTLYFLDKVFETVFRPMPHRKRHDSLKRYFTLYGMTLFRKPGKKPDASYQVEEHESLP